MNTDMLRHRLAALRTELGVIDEELAQHTTTGHPDPAHLTALHRCKAETLAEIDAIAQRVADIDEHRASLAAVAATRHD